MGGHIFVYQITKSRISNTHQDSTIASEACGPAPQNFWKMNLRASSRLLPSPSTPRPAASIPSPFALPLDPQSAPPLSPSSRLRRSPFPSPTRRRRSVSWSADPRRRASISWARRSLYSLSWSSTRSASKSLPRPSAREPSPADTS